MDGLGNVVSWEGQYTILDRSFPLAHLRSELLAALGADETLISYHPQQVLLRIGDIIEIAMRALDYPLGLGTLGPQDAAGGISCSRSTCIN